MKILLLSDSPMATSAYAIQALGLAKALQSARHEVIYFGATHPGKPMIYEGIQLVGNLGFMEGKQLIQHYINQYQVDCLLTMKDPYIFNPQTMGALTVPWIAITPIDTEPVSYAVLQALQHATRVITNTKFSQQQLAQAGIKADFAPYVVDAEFFTPGDGSTFRAQYGISPTAFMVALIGANLDNPSRKNLDVCLMAWADFVDKHPEREMVLWLHTDMTPLRGGIDLRLLIELMGIPLSSIRISDQGQYEQGFTPEYMRDLLRASDVLLSVGNEGFGLPVVEAAACGKPSIAVPFAASREVVKSGWMIPHGELIFAEIGAFRFRPHRGAVTEALGIAYDQSRDAKFTQDARLTALRYEQNAVYQNYWLPIMANIEAEIKEAVLA